MHPPQGECASLPGTLATVRTLDSLNMSPGRRRATNLQFVESTGAVSETRTLHMRKAGKCDAGFLKARACTANSPSKTPTRAGDFPRALPENGGQFQLRVRICKSAMQFCRRRALAPRVPAPRSPLAKRQHAQAMFQRRCQRAAGNSNCARAFAKARCNFVEGARWHRELPAQNANALWRFPKGVAGELREILAARADVRILGKCGANSSKARAGTASSLHKRQTCAGDFPRVSPENGGKF